MGGFQSNTLTNVTTSTLTFGTTSTAHSAFAFSANKPNTDAKPSFGAQTTQSQPTFGVSTTQPQQSGFGAFAPKFGENKNTTPTFGSISNPITTTSSTSIFGSSQMTPAFGSSNITAAQPKTDNVFGSVTNQATNTPVFGGQNSTSTFGKPANNVPTFGSANTSNIFGRTQNQPAFGASNSLFSTQTTAANPSQTSTSAFGSPAGVFAFGQSAPQPATTTAAAPTGIFSIIYRYVRLLQYISLICEFYLQESLELQTQILRPTVPSYLAKAIHSNRQHRLNQVEYLEQSPQKMHPQH